MSESNTSALEAATALLGTSDDYRVLRRLTPRRPITGIPEQNIRRGLFVDVETTGLDPTKDEIIELAMVPFCYSLDGIITEVGNAFEQLREPSHPIPPPVSALTGITDSMVAGHYINPDDVAKFSQSAAIVIAHNAAFDRKFLERFCPSFSSKPWACSMSEIDWVSEGYEGTKLAYLATECGFFYDRHRAVNDCLAALEILAHPLPVSGSNALFQLLEKARKPTWRIWADGAPFEFKEDLKSRGYRWNGDNNGFPRAWFIDVSEQDIQTEASFLQTKIYRRDVEVSPVKITAYDRFSERA